MVDYIGVSDIQRLVQSLGAGIFMERLAQEIEADYRRWGEFEKSARLASHSQVGVIDNRDPHVERAAHHWSACNGARGRVQSQACRERAKAKPIMVWGNTAGRADLSAIG